MQTKSKQIKINRSNSCNSKLKRPQEVGRNGIIKNVTLDEIGIKITGDFAGCPQTANRVLCSSSVLIFWLIVDVIPH